MRFVLVVSELSWLLTADGFERQVQENSEANLMELGGDKMGGINLRQPKGKEGNEEMEENSALKTEV